MGQVMGTSVGAHVFTKYGWRASAALSLGWSGFMLFMLLIRGPHVARYTWFGYEGGIEVRKSKLAERERLRAVDAEASVTANEAGSTDVVEEMHQKDDEATICVGEGAVDEGHYAS